MKLVFLGPPGAGKGTQAKIVSEKLGIPHISTGDIFRENIKNNTELGIKASEYMNKGFLVPDDITNTMVKERIKKHDCKNGYILDGYPRTKQQAVYLDSFDRIDKAIYFELSDNEIVKRISGRRTCIKCNSPYHIFYLKPKKEGVCDKCGSPLMQRDDEKEDVVLKRISVYKEQTLPLVDYYKQKGILLTIDASKNIQEITSDLLRVITQ